MAWNGWMQFGGTEIVNAERTARYVRNHLPALGFRNSYDSGDLPMALAYLDAQEDTVPAAPTYESPILDKPEWFDAGNPDTFGFYGFYPLSVEGMEDSTVTTSITELSDDGGFPSRPRAASRQIRLTGLLIGASDAAVSAGMVWLRRVLDGSPCDSGDCGGATLCYFSSTPSAPPPESLCGPGFLMAEDGSCVPESFYDTPPEGVLAAIERRPGVEEQVDCLLRQQRQMHNVVILNGPVVVDTYAPTQGAMTRVEIILVAGDPYIWGLPVEVPSVVNGPDVVGGTPADPWVLPTDRANLAGNPSMEVSAVSWVGSNGDEITRVVEADSPEGGAFGRVTFREPMDENYFLHLHTAVASGGTYTASLWLRSQVIRTVRARLWWYATTGDAAPLTTTTEPIALRPGWTRVSVTGVAPAGRTLVRPSIYFDPEMLPPTRINLADNPSSQVGPWSAGNFGVGGNGILARVATGGVDGGAFTRMTWTVGASSGGGIGGPVGTQNRDIPVAAQTDFGASVMVRASRNTYLQVDMGNAVGAPTECKPGVWTRLTVDGSTGVDETLVVSPVVRPSAQAGADPWGPGDTLDVDHLLIETGPSVDRLGTYFDGSVLGGDWSGAVGASTSILSPVLDFDALLLEATGLVLPYFDGNTPDTPFHRYEWVGNPDLSMSVRKPIAQPLVDCTDPEPVTISDPALPPVPAPPRAPVITNPAIRTIYVWNRRTQEIPANLIPVWSDAVPIVTVDNRQGVAIKTMRLRFYASPFGFPVRELEPCDFCGDFLVTYIPPGGIFTLDGQTQRAVIELPGGVEVDATHLLYGTGGQPFRWPLLSCGTTYFMTADVPWNDPVDEPTQTPNFTIGLSVVGRD